MTTRTSNVVSVLTVILGIPAILAWWAGIVWLLYKLLPFWLFVPMMVFLIVDVVFCLACAQCSGRQTRREEQAVFAGEHKQAILEHQIKE